jgi:hypothetical protein
MTKKQLATIVEDVQNVVAKAHGCTEEEARTLVGMAIRRRSADLVVATNPPPVAAPVLADPEAAEAA